MYTEKCRLGMIGLGVMGRNLVLNIADHGFTVAGYDKDKEQTEKLNEEGKDKNIHTFENFKSFIESLEKPKTIILLVPAGEAVRAPLW